MKIWEVSERVHMVGKTLQCLCKGDIEHLSSASVNKCEQEKMGATSLQADENRIPNVAFACVPKYRKNVGQPMKRWQ